MTILKWLSLIPLDIGFGLVAKLLNPIVVLFANDMGYLPFWLYWFGTPDNPLDGDAGWQTEHLWWKDRSSKFKRYINRWRWLNRNTAMGFSKSVMGAGALEEGFTFVIKGNPNIGNRPLVNGWNYIVLTTKSNKKYWQFYYVKSWNKTMCIRILLGWKIWSNPQPNYNPMFTLNFNPFMGYSDHA